MFDEPIGTVVIGAVVGVEINMRVARPLSTASRLRQIPDAGTLA
ncbi:hypothetical protein [Bradyrhizobium sp. 192]|nr:hypothetical protein [Bradyrhizobium sp. 192]